jgi:glutamate synthase domain-containing protein 3
VGADESVPHNPSRPIVVPELRDYHQINAEVVRRLNQGQRQIRLEGVEGQRLLVAGISGSWEATVELIGNAGPELAADLNAPGITVICVGSAADGAGRGLAAGRLVVLGSSGTATGYFQQGGLIVVRGGAGPRAGLCQRGGDLVLLDQLGALGGEGQSGGRLFFISGHAGAHLGHGAVAGRRVSLPSIEPGGGLPEGALDPEDHLLMEQALRLVDQFSHRE